MFAVTVRFEIKEGDVAAFLPLMRANAAQSLADEPGCHRFDICTDRARPTEVFLYELYENAAAFDAHLKSPHFLSFDTQTSDMISEKHVATYTSVTP